MKKLFFILRKLPNIYEITEITDSLQIFTNSSLFYLICTKYGTYRIFMKIYSINMREIFYISFSLDY